MLLIDPYRYEDSGPSAENGNWGAELQTLDFWTVTAGTPQVRANQAGRHPPEGVAIFDGGASATSRMEQVIDLSTVGGLDLGDIDAGLIDIRCVWWGGSFIQSVLDQPQLSFRFENAAHGTISQYDSGFKTPTLVVGGMSWNEYTDVTDVPTLTRFVAIICEMKRNTGTNNDAAFDDIRVSFEL